MGGRLRSMILATIAAMTPYGVAHATRADFASMTRMFEPYPLRTRSAGDRAHKRWKRRRATGLSR